MGKIVLLVILAFVVYALWRGAQRKADVRQPGGAPGGDARRRTRNRRGQGGAERMVSCERCKVHLPQGEAVLADGRWFCSEEHARLTGSA